MPLSHNQPKSLLPKPQPREQGMNSRETNASEGEEFESIIYVLTTQTCVCVGGLRNKRRKAEFPGHSGFSNVLGLYPQKSRLTIHSGESVHPSYSNELALFLNTPASKSMAEMFTFLQIEKRNCYNQSVSLLLSTPTILIRDRTRQYESSYASSSKANDSSRHEPITSKRLLPLLFLPHPLIQNRAFNRVISAVNKRPTHIPIFPCFDAYPLSFKGNRVILIVGRLIPCLIIIIGAFHHNRNRCSIAQAEPGWNGCHGSSGDGGKLDWNCTMNPAPRGFL